MKNRGVLETVLLAKIGVFIVIAVIVGLMFGKCQRPQSTAEVKRQNNIQKQTKAATERSQARTLSLKKCEDLKNAPAKVRLQCIKDRLEGKE